MSSSIEVLRVLLALIAVFFSVSLGRALMSARRGAGRRGRTITWTLRTTVALIAVCWHGMDLVAIAALVAAAAGITTGAMLARRTPRTDHLEELMFPKE